MLIKHADLALNKIKKGYTMKLYDIVKWDDGESSVNDIISYKHEAEDFNTHTQLIVHQSQEAVFFKDGMALDLFGPGKHTLSTQNIPLIKKLINIPTGGETPFHCDVFFVNKVYLADLRWGTPTPILMEDPLEQINIHVGANGLFGAHISDTRKFLTKIVGTRDRFSKDELGGYLRGKIIERVTDLLGKTMVDKQVSILSVSSHFTELSDSIKEQMVPFFEDYGIALDLFSFTTIKAPDEDLAEVNEAKKARRKMDLESEALARKRQREGYTYQQERGYDVLGQAASNEGTSSTFMGAGMGLGMGLGVGGAFGAGMANVANAGFNGMQQGQAAAAQVGEVCPNCKAVLPEGAAFCNKCGTRLGNVCPKCGAVQPKGVAFCNHCGASMKPVCPKCGAEVAEGAAFCNKCGTRLGGEPVKATCPNCGAEVAEGALFCNKCGTKLQ